MDNIKIPKDYYSVYWVDNNDPNVWGVYYTDEGYPWIDKSQVDRPGREPKKFTTYESAVSYVVDHNRMFHDSFDTLGCTLYVGLVNSLIHLYELSPAEITRSVYQNAISKLTSEELTAIKSMIKNEE